MAARAICLGLLSILLVSGGQAHAQTIAITDVAVVRPEEGIAEPGMTVVVVDGRITEVGSRESTPVPEGGTRASGTCRATSSRVEPGKVADLVLLDGNPLEDIGNTRRIRAVIARGRLLDREALDRVLRRAEQAAMSR